MDTTMESSLRMELSASSMALTMLSRSGLLSCGIREVGSCFLLSRCGLLNMAVMYTSTGILMCISGRCVCMSAS